MEKIKNPSKRQRASGPVGQEPCVSASTPVTRPKNPATTLACPSPDLCTRATNTFHTLGVAPEGLPEMEVKLDLPDRDKASSDHKRKARLWRPPRKQESDSPRRKSSFCPLPPGTPVSPSGKAHLQNQVEGALGLPACNGKRKAHCLGEPHLQSSASHAKCWASPSRSKPKGHCGAYDLHLAPGSEPPVQLEKRKVSKAKVRGRKEEGIKTRKKTRSLSLSAGCTPTPAQILFHQNTSPDRLEVSQPKENEASRQADILSAHPVKELRYPKQRKKKHLLRGVIEKLGPQPSLPEPPCLNKLIRDTEVETWGLDSTPGSLNPSHATPDVRQFFTGDLKNAYCVTCTLCGASVRRDKAEGRARGSSLIQHLTNKHNMEWDRRAVSGSPGQWPAGAGQAQEKKAGALSLGEPRDSPDTLPLEDSNRELALDRREQLLPALLPLPASPGSVKDSLSDTHDPTWPQAQAWNHRIAELLCGLALPLSFVSSLPFRRFMAQVDPCYHLPSPAFFSDKALPSLHEAMGDKVLEEMQWAEGGHVHFTTSVCAQDSVVSYMAVAAHWVTSKPMASVSLRKRAVLWVRGLTLKRATEDVQPELLEQISLWLGRGSLKAGFLVSGGYPSLEWAVRAEGYTHIPCFTHCLDSVVSNFLHHHHSVQIILGTARAICSHFKGSVEARSLLSQLQQQCGLPAQQPFEKLSDDWSSAYRLMEWLVGQQPALQAYAESQQLGKAGTALSTVFWSLADSLVKLLQPFQMVVREASMPQASLSQVLPQLRYLYIFLEQVHRHFQEQSVGDVGTALRLAEGLALQLSTDHQLNELFYREEFVLATLLDPRFKGKVEAILPEGADIDHWKQVLVYKVKEIMVTEYLPTFSGRCKSMHSSTTRRARAERKGQRESLCRQSDPGPFLLVQREKSLLEQLESVGLLVSQSSRASLSTENHMASVIVRQYLRDNETIGAQEDPLAYWERKRSAWPALAQLATTYLSCPPTRAFSESVLASLDSPTIVEQKPPLKVEAIEHLLFLKTNLEYFPHYTPPHLVISSSDLAEREQTS
ncbi:zinc finger BED domain-containing protein 6 [Cavia porcellus]|uniref:zinc finger BED domain-containing protein 6 n=1 Tax=Cavia porcellus TaxID=10141 RepID=UPI000661F612|nr:ZBED6 C-terminal-like protein isoform X2 [Cavia porcellus]